MPFVHDLEGVVERNRALIDAFHAHRLQVALVSVVDGAPGRTEQPPHVAQERPSDFAELLPALGRRDDDILITKRSRSAFANTDLEARLRAQGVTQVVITGVATGTGVEATVRQAYETGFNVTLPIDAVTDLRAQAHDYSVAQIFPRLAETGSPQDVLALLRSRS